MHAIWVVCYFDIYARAINVHTTVAVFQNLLPVLKIYSAHNKLTINLLEDSLLYVTLNIFHNYREGLKN